MVSKFKVIYSHIQKQSSVKCHECGQDIKDGEVIHCYPREYDNFWESNSVPICKKCKDADSFNYVDVNDVILPRQFGK